MGHGGRGGGTRQRAWPALVAIGLASLACGSGGRARGGTGYDVAVNPYGTSPLVAVVNLHGIEASDVRTVEVVVFGQDGVPDFATTYSPDAPDAMDTSDLSFPEPGLHVPVVGLYADRESDVRIHVDRRDEDAVEVTLPIEARLAN